MGRPVQRRRDPRPHLEPGWHRSALGQRQRRPPDPAAQAREGGLRRPVQRRTSPASLHGAWTAPPRLWDSASGIPLIPRIKHLGSVRGARFSRNSSRVLTWSYGIVGDEADVRLWDSTSGSLLALPLKHNDVVRGALFSEDESRILTWSRDRTARLWDSASGTPVTPPLEHYDTVDGALFSPDESRILTWSRDGAARLWNGTSGAPLTPALKHKGPVRGARFSPDGSQHSLVERRRHRSRLGERQQHGALRTVPTRQDRSSVAWGRSTIPERNSRAYLERRD